MMSENGKGELKLDYESAYNIKRPEERAPWAGLSNDAVVFRTGFADAIAVQCEAHFEPMIAGLKRELDKSEALHAESVRGLDELQEPGEITAEAIEEAWNTIYGSIEFKQMPNGAKQVKIEFAHAVAARVRPKPAPISEGCPVHENQIHGAEAEEIRAGVEALIATHHIDEGDLKDELQALLGRVDARDSLAHAEAKAALSDEPCGMVPVESPVQLPPVTEDEAEALWERWLAPMGFDSFTEFTSPGRVAIMSMLNDARQAPEGATLIRERCFVSRNGSLALKHSDDPEADRHTVLGAVADLEPGATGYHWSTFVPHEFPSPKTLYEIALAKARALGLTDDELRAIGTGFSEAESK